MLPYTKPFLDLPVQIRLLQSRGLEVTDTPAATAYLRRVGYYRLSGYWYPFRRLVRTHPPLRDDTFLRGSRFKDAAALYVFDKKLKLILLDAIERVEIAIRVEIALLFGAKHPVAYTDSRHFDSQFRRLSPHTGKSKFDDWSDKFNGMVARSNDEFIRHYKNKYQLPLPIWIAIELWDFGLLSWFYSGMLVADRQQVAQTVSVPDWRLLQSWLRSLNHVRNIIAHHGRLWNRSLVDYPTLPRPGTMPAFDVLSTFSNVEKKIYTICCILRFLLETINPNSAWKMRLVNHIDSFPVIPHAQIGDMGFPPNWKAHSFWT